MSCDRCSELVERFFVGRSEAVFQELQPLLDECPECREEYELLFEAEALLAVGLEPDGAPGPPPVFSTPERDWLEDRVFRSIDEDAASEADKHSHQSPIPGLRWLVSLLIGAVAVAAAAVVVTTAPAEGTDDGFTARGGTTALAGHDLGSIRAYCMAGASPQPLVDSGLSAATYCPFGSVLAFSAVNATKGLLYARIVVFAHGSTATFVWPERTKSPTAGAVRPGGQERPLDLQVPLRTSGATVVAMLSPEPITDQYLRTVARRVSSRNEAHTSAYVISWTVHSSGARNR